MPIPSVGHSPTNEAAVLGLTGSIIEPMAKGAGVLVVAEDDRARIEPVRYGALRLTSTENLFESHTR
jgi:hypothetical protein